MKHRYAVFLIGCFCKIVLYVMALFHKIHSVDPVLFEMPRLLCAWMWIVCICVLLLFLPVTIRQFDVLLSNTKASRIWEWLYPLFAVASLLPVWSDLLFLLLTKKEVDLKHDISERLMQKKPLLFESDDSSKHMDVPNYTLINKGICIKSICCKVFLLATAIAFAISGRCADDLFLSGVLFIGYCLLSVLTLMIITQYNYRFINEDEHCHRGNPVVRAVILFVTTFIPLNEIRFLHGEATAIAPAAFMQPSKNMYTTRFISSMPENLLAFLYFSYDEIEEAPIYRDIDIWAVLNLLNQNYYCYIDEDEYETLYAAINNADGLASVELHWNRICVTAELINSISPSHGAIVGTEQKIYRYEKSFFSSDEKTPEAIVDTLKEIAFSEIEGGCRIVK